MPVRKCLWGLVQLYRLVLSPYLGGRCRFHPSCSVYAQEVLLTHPPHRSLFLVLKRLLKCHPLGPYGVDLPPLSGKAHGKERPRAKNGEKPC